VRCKYGKEVCVSRFEDTEIALIDELRALDRKLDMTVNLLNIEESLNAIDFLQDDIMSVLSALEQDRIIEFVPGKRLRQLKPLP
jgi:hypothetical protein